MCNAAIMTFLKSFQYLCRPEFDVLEVGSLNVNGTPRTIFKPLARSYIGVDIVEGDGVDQIVDASQLLQAFRREQFDMVISTEMLEHCLDWRAAITQMKTVLKPGGYFLLTARSPGFGRHNEPDYWRFTIAHFRWLVSDFEQLELMKDSERHGVFVAAVKPAVWYPCDLDIIQPYPAPP